MIKKYRFGVISDTGRGNYGHGIDSVWLKIPQTEIVGIADADQEVFPKDNDANRYLSREYRKGFDLPILK